MIGDTIRLTVEQIRQHGADVRIVQATPRIDEVTQIALVPGKEVSIAGGVATMVLKQTSRGQCSLGFAAPRNIPIHRQEIYDKIAMGDT